jgi:transposase
MRKKTTKEPQKPQKEKTKNVVEMPLVNVHAAGIDIGDKEHAVAVPGPGGKQKVRTFGTMTSDLKEIIAWLEEEGINSVAMESTGVYWKPLFSMLVKESFEVLLVNSRHVKNVYGRKTDEDDAMWIQKLHSCGLLRSSFLPDAEQEDLRKLTRHRRTLTEESSRFINRLQRSLELMNIKFHTVINDITGKSGLAVVEAIIAGERNAENFLPLIDGRVKADAQTICRSLEGNWHEKDLFILKECYESYKFFQSRIAVCDKEIETQLLKYEAYCNDGEIEIKKERSKAPVKAIPDFKKKKKGKNHPKFDIRSYLYRIYGIDVMAMSGLNEMGALTLLAELGTDLKNKWPRVEQFISWLNVCPNNKISGGKLISSRLMKKKANAASQAFRYAAGGVQNSKSWIGDYFRRSKAKGGFQYACIAVAKKLATIFYHIVCNKVDFNPDLQDKYQQAHNQRKIASLEKRLAELKREAA